MRITLLPLLLCFAATAPAVQAASIHYDIVFTGFGDQPASGSFNYDAAAPLFTNFVVNWNGTAFDLTAAANQPLVKPPVAPACLGGLTGAAASFALLSGSCPLNESSWDAYQSNGIQFFGFQFDSDDDSTGIYVEVAYYGGGNFPTTGGHGDWTISSDLNLNQGVPEPASVTLVAIASATLFLYRRRSSR